MRRISSITIAFIIILSIASILSNALIIMPPDTLEITQSSTRLNGTVQAVDVNHNGTLVAYGLGWYSSTTGYHGEVGVLYWNGSLKWSTGDLGNKILSVEFNPNDTLVAAAYRGGDVLVYYADNGSLKWDSGYLGASVKSVAWSPDGNFLAAGIGTKVALFTAGGTQIWTSSSLGAYVLGLSWSPDGKYIAAAAGRSYKLAVLYASNGSIKWSKAYNATVQDVNWNPTGNMLAVVLGSPEYRIITVNASDGVVIWSSESLYVSSRYIPEEAEWSPNGNRIAATGAYNKTYILDKYGSILWESIPLPRDVNTIAWTPNASYIIAGSGKNVYWLTSPHIHAGSITICTTKNAYSIISITQNTSQKVTIALNQSECQALITTTGYYILNLSGGTGFLSSSYALYNITIINSTSNILTLHLIPLKLSLSSLPRIYFYEITVPWDLYTISNNISIINYIILKIYNINIPEKDLNKTKLFWYNGATWLKVTPYKLFKNNKTIIIIINHNTSPNISQLNGTPIVAIAPAPVTGGTLAFARNTLLFKFILILIIIYIIILKNYLNNILSVFSTIIPLYRKSICLNVACKSNSVRALIPSIGTTTLYHLKAALATVCNTQILATVPTTTVYLTPYTRRRSSSGVP